MHIDYYGVASLTILLELHNIGIQMAKGMNQNKTKIDVLNLNNFRSLRKSDILVWLEKSDLPARKSDIIFALIFTPLDKV